MSLRLKGDKNRIWWKEAVGYQIYPRTFFDTNNDGIGDLKGINSKLDYLEKLGVGIIWICPFFCSPQDDNGYDISNFYHVDPIFGTDEDLDELVKNMHSRGMHIIIDFVLNHTSDENPWFIEARQNKNSEEHDYYIWKDGKIGKDGKMMPPNNWQGIMTDSVWSYDEVAKQYYMHIFSKKMPDLNWENPKLRQKMYSIAKYWLDKGVDGFRLDAIAHLARNQSFADSKRALEAPNGKVFVLNQFPDINQFSNLPRLFDYLKEFKQEVLSKYDCLTIGEVGGFPVPDEALKYSSYDHGPINMVFNFTTCWENGGENSEGKTDDQIVTNVYNLKHLFKKWYDAYNGKAWMPIYWLNHDHPRVLSQYGSVKFRKESAKMLATTLLFMYGTPFLYNGEEIGMSNVDYTEIEDFKDVSSSDYWAKKDRNDKETMLTFLRRTSRINARTPMQWSDAPYAGFSTVEPIAKLNGNYLTVNVKSQEDDPDSILNFYRKAISVRKNPDILDTVLDGKFNLIDENNLDVFAYEHVGKKHLAVISNFRKETVKFTVKGNIKEFILHNYKDIIRKAGVITLRPFESYLIEMA